MNNAEEYRGSAWLLLFVAGQQQGRDWQSAKGRILYTRKCLTSLNSSALHRKFVNGNYATAGNADNAPHVYAPYSNATQEFASYCELAYCKLT